MTKVLDNPSLRGPASGWGCTSADSSGLLETHETVSGSLCSVFSSGARSTE